MEFLIFVILVMIFVHTPVYALAHFRAHSLSFPHTLTHARSFPYLLMYTYRRENDRSPIPAQSRSCIFLNFVSTQVTGHRSQVTLPHTLADANCLLFKFQPQELIFSVCNWPVGTFHIKFAGAHVWNSIDNCPLVRLMEFSLRFRYFQFLIFYTSQAGYWQVYSMNSMNFTNSTNSMNSMNSMNSQTPWTPWTP